MSVACTDLTTSVHGADYVIVSTPTNYDETTNFFDTSSVDDFQLFRITQRLYRR